MRNKLYGKWWKALAVGLQILSVTLLMSTVTACFMGKITTREVDRLITGKGPIDYLESELFAGTMYGDLQRAIQLTWYERIFETNGVLDMDKSILKVIGDGQGEEYYCVRDILISQVGGGYLIAPEFQEGKKVQVLWFPLANIPSEDPLKQELTQQNAITMKYSDIAEEVKDALWLYEEIKEDLMTQGHNVYYAFAGSVKADNGMNSEEIVKLPRYYRSKWTAYRNVYEESGNVALFAPSGYNPYYGTPLEVASYDMMTKDGDRLYIGVDTKFPAQDRYTIQQKYWQMEQNVIWFLIYIAPAALLVWLITLVYLIGAAGKSRSRMEENEVIQLNWFDRIPMELILFSLGVLAAAEMIVLLELSVFRWRTSILSASFYWEGTLLDVAISNGWIATVALAMFLALDCMLSTAILLRLIRRKRYGSSNSWILTGVNMVIRLFRKNVKLSFQTAVPVCGAMALIALFAFGAGKRYYHIEIFLVSAVLAITLIATITLMLVKKAQEKDQLLREVERIADGQMREEMELTGYTGVERQLAEHISNIRTGMETALDQAMKNERLKTELISNVSHDIKTPLTSIINYSDLLKRELVAENAAIMVPGSEKQQRILQYLEVLEQKSKRLKVLTEDLVEASKASSGVLQITPERINLIELVTQVNGEFEEKFAERQLQVVPKYPGEAVYVLADGRRMWRILENLYQNVYKYAMSGTRVYVEIAAGEEQATFTIKNISAEPLNISEEELTERFVRGDAARSTEGSGLGLSIAQSLTELQKGSFRVSVEGDLFRVRVDLPLWSDNNK